MNIQSVIPLSNIGTENNSLNNTGYRLNDYPQQKDINENIEIEIKQQQNQNINSQNCRKNTDNRRCQTQKDKFRKNIEKNNLKKQQMQEQDKKTNKFSRNSFQHPSKIILLPRTQPATYLPMKKKYNYDGSIQASDVIHIYNRQKSSLSPAQSVMNSIQQKSEQKEYFDYQLQQTYLQKYEDSIIQKEKDKEIDQQKSKMLQENNSKDLPGYMKKIGNVRDNKKRKQSMQELRKKKDSFYELKWINYKNYTFKKLPKEKRELFTYQLKDDDIFYNNQEQIDEQEKSLIELKPQQKKKYANESFKKQLVCHATPIEYVYSQKLQLQALDSEYVNNNNTKNQIKPHTTKAENQQQQKESQQQYNFNNFVTQQSFKQMKTLTQNTQSNVNNSQNEINQNYYDFSHKILLQQSLQDRKLYKQKSEQQKLTTLNNTISQNPQISAGNSQRRIQTSQGLNRNQLQKAKSKQETLQEDSRQINTSFNSKNTAMTSNLRGTHNGFNFNKNNINDTEQSSRPGTQNQEIRATLGSRVQFKRQIYTSENRKRPKNIKINENQEEQESILQDKEFQEQKSQLNDEQNQNQEKYIQFIENQDNLIEENKINNYQQNSNNNNYNEKLNQFNQQNDQQQKDDAIEYNKLPKGEKLNLVMQMFTKLQMQSNDYILKNYDIETVAKEDQKKSLKEKNSSDKPILLIAFLANFQIFSNNNEKTIQNIMRGLGLTIKDKDILSYSNTVNIDQILTFYRLLIHKDSAYSETIKFVIRFFGFIGQYSSKMPLDIFQNNLYSLYEGMDKEKLRIIENKLYESEVIKQDQDFVIMKKFKQQFQDFKIDIYDIIDAICLPKNY